MLFVCVQLASRYTPICLAANRCISIASARPKEHTSLSINYSLYINYTFVKALPRIENKVASLQVSVHPTCWLHYANVITRQGAYDDGPSPARLKL